MIYLLDASTLITAHAQYYPIGRVPEFWEWLQHHVDAGTIRMPIEIFEEIKEGPQDEGRDELFAWISDPEVGSKIVLSEEQDPTLVDATIRNGYAADLTDTELEQVGRDPFLIASARMDVEKRVVVTAEVSSPAKRRHNRRIPDVCKQFGVRSMDVFGLVKELDFTTSWNRR